MAVDQLLDIEKAIADTVRRLSFLQYLIMQKSGDWGTAGRERVTSGFSRHILGLSDDATLTGEDTNQFHLLVERETSEFAEKSPTELATLEKETGFLLNDQFIRKEEMKKINELLEQEKSTYRIFYGYYEKFRIIIFGPTTIKKIGDHTVVVMDEEKARTPSAILPMVAAHGEEHQIIIRREALTMIYYEKWITPAILPGYSPEVDLRERWKDLTVNSYLRDKKMKGKKIQKTMVDEMIETTAVHETAHGAIRDQYADKRRLALGRILYAMPYSFIIQALDEILAEWMPKDGFYSGAIPYIASIAEKGNKDQAIRLFYRYISDSWFLGNWDQAYLNDLTELFIGSLVPYIHKPGEVDFAKILADTAENYRFFQGWWDKVIDGTLEIMEKATYVHRGFTISFKDLSQAQHESFLMKGAQYTPDTEIYQRYFWQNMLGYLEKIAPQDFQKLKDYFKTVTEEMKKDLLAKLTDRAENTLTLKEWMLSETTKRIATTQQ